MPRKETVTRAITLLSILLIVSACAPRAGAGVQSGSPDSASLTLDLPALVLDFDLDGQPSIGNLPLSLIGDQFAIDGLDAIAAPADVIRYLVDSNIQHLQLSNSPSGLIVMINGRTMPSLKWDGGELENASQVINLLGADLGAGMSLLETLLPLVSQVGIGIVARFPVPGEIDEIPLVVDDASQISLAANRIQEDFLSVVETPPAVSVPVYYDAQGSWRVGDLTYAEWISLTGMPVFDSFRLKPDVVDRLIRQGISEFTVASDRDGIHVSINGNELPYIGWADGELSNAFLIARQAGLLDSFSEQNQYAQDVITLVEALLPVVQATEITITAHFPESLVVVAAN